MDLEMMTGRMIDAVMIVGACICGGWLLTLIVIIWVTFSERSELDEE